MSYKKNQFSYNQKEQLYTAEASTLQLRYIPDELVIENLHFYLYSVDKNGFGEDEEVAGWIYAENKSKPLSEQTTVLIIND